MLSIKRRPILSDIWKDEKNAKIEGKKSNLAQNADAASKDRLDAEKKVAATMAAAHSAKLAALSAPPEILPMDTPAEAEAPAETEVPVAEAPAAEEPAKTEGEAPAAE